MEAANSYSDREQEPDSVWFWSRLEGEPVWALSGLVCVALHPVSLRCAGCLLPAAADLRPAAGVHPQRRPALLLQPGAPARTPLHIRLLQVTKSSRFSPDHLMWGSLVQIKSLITLWNIQVHTVSFCRSKVYWRRNRSSPETQNMTTITRELSVNIKHCLLF